MNIDLPLLGVMLVTGMMLGLAYYLGLWMTVKRLHRSRSPALLALGSLVLRLGLLLVALYLLTGMQASALIASLVGIILARLLLQRLLNAAWQENLKEEEKDSCISRPTTSCCGKGEH